MSALEIHFRCMCCFVPDPKNGCVHILMPSTQVHGGHSRPGPGGVHGHGDGGVRGAVHGNIHGDIHGEVCGGIHGNVHGDILGNVHGSVHGAIHGGVLGGVPGTSPGHGASIPPHVARIRFNDVPQKGTGIEGRALVLGEGGIDPADMTLRLADDPDEIADLSSALVAAGINADRIDPALVSDSPGPRVVSRITLRAGKLKNLVAQALWDIPGRTDVRMAAKVVWEIEDFPPGPLSWLQLNAAETPEPEPIPGVVVPDGVACKLEVFHMTEASIPLPNIEPEGSPSDEIAHHFGAYYPLFGVTPTERLIPKFKGGIGSGGDLAVTCSCAMGTLGGG